MYADERRVFDALLTAWGIIILLSFFYILVAVLYQKRRVKAYLAAAKAEFDFLEAERRRVSTELHDHIGASLSSLQLTLSRLPSPNALQQSVLAEAILLIQSTSYAARTLSYELQPIALQYNSLPDAIEELLLPFFQSGIYEVQFVWDADIRVFEPDVSFHLHRMVQEILNNILKHAQANRIDIHTYEKKGSLFLSIRDNGKGFDIPQTRQPGMGLRNLRMRADLLQASLFIDSIVNGGTHYLLQVPRRVATRS